MNIRAKASERKEEIREEDEGKKIRRREEDELEQGSRKQRKSMAGAGINLVQHQIQRLLSSFGEVSCKLQMVG
ncbi:hypothetical protein AXG93_2817s1300 [Marchantia polymorpha subsp. ruderalis]|uniref:Uncharacterized protein n=1 Tax=Marchantia polymorpha subsp. ruderalis TaxID=1480154 RepID=A0A176W4E2_MARPO|nr:hypothetical protein AXG93_2817s1300 [Marchantia polymorpha subsp. ruderalis]